MDHKYSSTIDELKTEKNNVYMCIETKDEENWQVNCI